MQPAAETRRLTESLYVLTWLHDAGEIAIVGPFATDVEAAAYGEAWQGANGDNPCWQTLARPDGSAPHVMTMTSADAHAGFTLIRSTEPQQEGPPA